MKLPLTFLMIAFLHYYHTVILYSYPVPLNCTDTTRSCTSFIAFKPDANQSFAIVQSMFDVLPHHITVEEGDSGYLYIQKNCSCSSSSHKYLTNTTFTVRGDGGPVRGFVKEAYHGLAVIPNTTRIAGAGAVVSVRLFCGCSSSLWNYLIAYVMGDDDSLQSLASRFGVSMDAIERVNGIANPDNITAGFLYYIPLNSVPGNPYPAEHSINPAPVPAPSESYLPVNEVVDESHVSRGWIFGGVGIGVAFLVLSIALCLYVWSSSHFTTAIQRMRTKDPDRKALYGFHSQTSSFCSHSCGHLCYSSGGSQQADGECSNRELSLPKAVSDGAFNVEKPLVFTYNEILSSTAGFCDSNLLGHGTYGSVYYGILRDQEVAIKKMFVAKSKEFMAEMNILCTVNHSNLVELVGYAASSDDLFLVNEFAPKGSLAAHLHDPQSRGYPSLSWVMRVQIALDAARGIEYIHEHTKVHFVHRDIKTSNILLDNAFRAKISDFGLAKLAGRSNETTVSTTGVVGTFGYMAPEYLQDGLATTKSDVYAFGIVLFEMVSGREAVIQSDHMALQSSKTRHSLASIMLVALRKTPNSMSISNMKDHIYPNLSDIYPHDCVFKMAMLAKQCVDDDPVLWPDMKQIVISLSQILLSSVEWEATLAGNSQVFSGLVQGR